VYPAASLTPFGTVVFFLWDVVEFGWALAFRSASWRANSEVMDALEVREPIWRGVMGMADVLREPSAGVLVADAALRGVVVGGLAPSFFWELLSRRERNCWLFIAEVWAAQAAKLVIRGFLSEREVVVSES
jgi:hypothetical protein